MPIFRLMPLSEHLNHPDWRASTRNRSCYVCAKNKEAAIRLIENETRIAVSRKMGQEISVSPWRNPDLVFIKDVAHMGGQMPPEGTFWFEEEQAAS